MNHFKILAVSGSLRRTSYNTALLNTLNELSPDSVEVQIYTKLNELPLFNPDLEENLPQAVRHLKDALATADGLIISSPEYAHGITGVLKNALDWLVSGEEFVYMPVALFNTSPRASHAQAALREVVTTMSGNIIDKANLTIPLLGSGLDTRGILENQTLCPLIAAAMTNFITGIRDAKP